MKKEIYLAAATGDAEFLKKARANDVEAGVPMHSDDDLMGVTSHGNNIIHVAAKHGHLHFIKEALEGGFDATQTTKLVCGTNSDGDTPLHMAAKLDASEVAEHLVAAAPGSELWRIRNNKGNAPLHVALMNGGKSIRVAAYLLGVGPEVASYDNHRKQTPLHLAVSYNNQDAKMSMTNTVNKLNSFEASVDYTKSLFEEDSLSLIKQLLDSAATMCSCKDEDEMTPLLRAAQKSYLSAVEHIMKCYPECVEICDPKGKSVLHYIKFPTFLKAREFMRIPGISILMDQQDVDGNTPLHTAILNCDVNMVKAMVECNANFAIQNNEGISPNTLIHSSTSGVFDNTKDDIRRSNMIVKDEIMMPKEIIEAAYNRNWEYLLKRLRDPQYDDHHFLSRLPDGSNILHVVLQQHKISTTAMERSFMEEVGKKLPILLCQTDFNGCTPIHSWLTSSISLFDITIDSLKCVLKEIKGQASCYPLLPWEAKDFNGDTLLHLALRYRKYEMAKLLIEEMVDAKSFRETNNSNETPLHVLCRHGSPKKTDTVKLLIEKDESVVHMYDADGLTPLLRAVKSNTLLYIGSEILEKCPETIKQVDSQFGRNLLHFLPDYKQVNSRSLDKELKEFINRGENESLMYQVDREGNTPLHLAILERRFDSAQLLLSKKERRHLFYNGENNDGKTAMDLLETTQDIPASFEKCSRHIYLKMSQNEDSGFLKKVCTASSTQI